jgi:nicotinate-nucleotide adenylyltransferase
MSGVGLLGGTFDPIHHGHLAVAQAALDVLELDEVRLLVAGDPWQKEPHTPAVVRTELARLAVEDHDEIVVDDRECRRSGPTYTVDTLLELHEAEPGIDLVFLLGADAVARLATWHQSDVVLALARFVAVTRPGHDMPRLPATVDVLEVPPLDISSSQLRGLAARGRSLRYLVPDPVRRRIGEYGLYGPDDGA